MAGSGVRFFPVLSRLDFKLTVRWFPVLSGPFRRFPVTFLKIWVQKGKVSREGREGSEGLGSRVRWRIGNVLGFSGRQASSSFVKPWNIFYDMKPMAIIRWACSLESGWGALSGAWPQAGMVAGLWPRGMTVRFGAGSHGFTSFHMLSHAFTCFHITF